MKKIQFTENERTIITKNILRYFEDELDHEISRFDAESLLDFFTSTVGAYYYNRGLYDAQASMEKRMENLVSETIDSLEKPTDFVR